MRLLRTNANIKFGPLKEKRLTRAAANNQAPEIKSDEKRKNF